MDAGGKGITIPGSGFWLMFPGGLRPIIDIMLFTWGVASISNGASNFWNVFWILLLIWSFWPVLRQRRIEASRYRLITDLERKRHSRVITLIHRQEAISILGIALSRYINIEDSEQVLRAIRLTPPEMPIDLILHTPGGLVLAAEQIAHAIKEHPAPVTVFVPHYAMSGGTMLALAADEILMDENAVLGPVDPQIGEYPAVSILRAVNRKDANELDDKTLILADVAEKALVQVEEFILGLLKGRHEEAENKRIARELSSGQWTHDYPLTPEKVKAIGLEVTVGLPSEVYDLMDLYPQVGVRRPSVQYIPIPYERHR